MQDNVIVTDNNFIVSGLSDLYRCKVNHLYYRDFIENILTSSNNTLIFDISDWQIYMSEIIKIAHENRNRIILWDYKNKSKKVSVYEGVYLLRANSFSDFLFGINEIDKRAFLGTPISHTTHNEIMVVKLLSLGYNLTSISVMLKKSIRTVSGQKKSFMRRLGIKNNVRLLCFMSIFFQKDKA